MNQATSSSGVIGEKKRRRMKMSKYLGLLATLIASLIILAVVVTGCGGGGGTKPLPVDRQIDIARFVRLIGDQKVAVSDLHVVWTINGQTTISQTRSDGILAITVRQQGAFRVSLSSADSPPAFDPLVIDVPAGGMATPREVQLLTEIVITRSFGDLPPVDWETNIAVWLYIIEPDGTVIAPANEPKAVATPTEDDFINDGGCALTYDKIANDENGEPFIRFLVNRPGKANVTAYASDRLTEAIRGIVTIVDNQPPEIKNVVPANGTTVKDVVDINCRVEDNYAVKNVVITANGKTLTTRQESRGQQIFHASWDTTEEADGSAQLTFQAWDAVGAESAITTVNVTVKNPWVLPSAIGNPRLELDRTINVDKLLRDAGYSNVTVSFDSIAIGPDGKTWLLCNRGPLIINPDDSLTFVNVDDMPGWFIVGPADVDKQGRIIYLGGAGLYRLTLLEPGGVLYERFLMPSGVDDLRGLFVDWTVSEPSGQVYVSYQSTISQVELRDGKAIEKKQWPIDTYCFAVDGRYEVLFANDEGLNLKAIHLTDNQTIDYGYLSFGQTLTLILLPHVLALQTLGKGEDGDDWDWKYLQVVGYNGELKTVSNYFPTSVCRVTPHLDANNSLRMLYIDQRGDMSIDVIRVVP